MIKENTAMKILAIIWSALLIAGSSASKPKIVGGEETTINDVPYQVKQEQKQLGFFWAFSCGGVIVGANTVVTAGHCAKGVTPDRMRFRSGSTERVSGTIHDAVKVVVHPDYIDNEIAYNDIAVITVTPPFEFSNTTQLIELASKEPLAGDNATVSGWGVTSDTSSSPSDILRKVNVPIVDRKTCEQDYGADMITDAMICAGLPEGGKDACSGDSGGPFVVNGLLAGVVSWGMGCAEPGYPGVYTNVAKFYNWAQEIIDANNQLLKK